jgi:K+-sensing histidine kinase KdpD
MPRKTNAVRKDTKAEHRAKPSTRAKESAELAQVRALAHDLSNALEAILQAAYLLGQSKLDEGPRRWAQLIDSSSQDAARLNREIRKLLRSMSGD